MKPRLLAFGNRIKQISDFDEIAFSNYSLQAANESSWKSKLTKIEKKIDSNEIRCVIFVLCNWFFYETENLAKEKLLELIRVCKKTKCLVLAQGFVLDEKPVYHEYLSKKKYTTEELHNLINNLENELKFLDPRNLDAPFEEYKTPFDENDDGYREHLYNQDTYTSREINKYKDKLRLLKETEEIFPRIKETLKIFEVEFDEIIPFQFINQIYETIKDEIVEIFSNEILNIYIQTQYGYRYEFDDFIQLFEKYLKNVENLKLSVEVFETKKGINYKFISIDKTESITDLPNKLNRFTEFVDLCEKQPEQALSIIENNNIDSEKALEIIQRLSKKYKRLALDIQQRKELLELQYKQEIQTELFEHQHLQTPFSLVKNDFSVQSLDNLYNPNPTEIEYINILKKHQGDINIQNVKYDLGILNDEEIKDSDRKRSAFKLKKPLLKLLEKGLEHAERIAVEAIVTYINSKIN